MTDETATASATSDEGKKLLRRRVYVMARLEAIKGELQTLRNERTALATNIKAAAEKEKRVLVRRRTYVTMHLEVLLNEQKALLAERKKPLPKA